MPPLKAQEPVTLTPEQFLELVDMASADAPQWAIELAYSMRHDGQPKYAASRWKREGR
jgi:hypothetical protein